MFTGPQRSQWKKSRYCRRGSNKSHRETLHSPPSGTSSSDSFSSSSAVFVSTGTHRLEAGDGKGLGKRQTHSLPIGLGKSRPLLSISTWTRWTVGQQEDTCAAPPGPVCFTTWTQQQWSFSSIRPITLLCWNTVKMWGSTQATCLSVCWRWTESAWRWQVQEEEPVKEVTRGGGTRCL